MAAPIPSTITQTVTILPGQEFVLPNGANIISIIASGDATAESDCTLPDLSEYACSYFKITLDYGEVDYHAMDEKYVKMQTLTIGDTNFDFNGQKIITSGDGGDGVVITTSELNAYITDLSLFKFTGVGWSGSISNARQIVWLYFQAPEPLISTIIFELTDRDNPIYFKAGTTSIACGEYPNP